MQLSYWISPCLNDSSAYSIRAKTKKEVVAQMKERNEEADGCRYGPVKKVTIEYKDAFDLMLACSDESRGWWEV